MYTAAPSNAVNALTHRLHRLHLDVTVSDWGRRGACVSGYGLSLYVGNASDADLAVADLIRRSGDRLPRTEDVWQAMRTASAKVALRVAMQDCELAAYRGTVTPALRESLCYLTREMAAIGLQAPPFSDTVLSDVALKLAAIAL